MRLEEDIVTAPHGPGLVVWLAPQALAHPAACCPLHRVNPRHLPIPWVPAAFSSSLSISPWLWPHIQTVHSVEVPWSALLPG